MRFLLASVALILSVPVMAQDQTETCNSQLFIVSRYLAGDEQAIIQLRASLVQEQKKVADLTKQLEEAKAATEKK